jgi:predicted MFS family arabinose efflux permease
LNKLKLLWYGTNLSVAAFFYIFRGVFANMSVPINQTRIISYIHPAVRATGSALLSTARWLAWTSFSPIVGLFIDLYGFQPMFLLTALIYTIGLLMFLLIINFSAPYTEN